MTPFGRRTVSADQIVMPSPTPPRDTGRIDKWALFARLRTARASFGLKDRSLAVLNALLSFLPHRLLDNTSDLIVFPSNRTLSDRVHGMPESTLRRHLATLLRVGLIARHDSPNGKRYAARDRSGGMLHAFGFDLGPLFDRSDDIEAAAIAADHERECERRLREIISLHRRDASLLLDQAHAVLNEEDRTRYAERLHDLQRRSRRRLACDDLQTLAIDTTDLRADLTQKTAPRTPDLAANDGHSERHIQETREEFFCSKPDRHPSKNQFDPDPNPRPAPEIHLETVLQRYPEITAYAPEKLRAWDDLYSLAQSLHEFIGIPPRVWQEAGTVIGPHSATLSLCYVLERLSDIRSPAAYFRTLTQKAANGQFNPLAMFQRSPDTSIPPVDSCQLENKRHGITTDAMPV